MINEILKELKETKDVSVDYNKDFEISIHDGNIIITQLFGYNTKYPIFIKTDKTIKKFLNLEHYDIDVTAVYTNTINNRVAIIIEFNVDSKELEDLLKLKVEMVAGKEKIYKI